MAGKLAKIPDETREAIRAEYLLHIPINDLAKKYQVSTAVIAAWRSDENWSEIRRAGDEGFLDDLVQGRKIRLAKLAEIGIDQIERGLIAIKQRAEPATLKELEQLSVVISNLDRLHRLDRGVSTQNVAVNVTGQLSIERIRDTIMADPFFVKPTPAPQSNEE